MNRFISAILLITLTLAISSVNVLADINHVPDDFETIQEAIDATHNLDTVLVQPGVYVENICFNGRRIVVGSLFLITGDYEFILNTIIDGNERSRVVSFIDQECRQAVLTGFTIRNGSTTYGGGIYICEANPTLKHLIVSGNSATRRAGGIYCTHGSCPALTSVTVVGNQAGDNQGGIHAFHNSNPTIVNSIFWDNDPPEIHHVVEITFSDVEGGFEGEGNIDADPLFVDPNNDDYHLTENSPCIDAGTDVGLPFTGEAPDMGAMEFIPIERERHFRFMQTDNNHSLLITDATLSGQPLPEGDEIGVFSPAGLCCGGEVWEGEQLGLAAWGDDPQTDEFDGLRDGEEMGFRMWDWESRIEYHAISHFEQGDTLFGTNGFSVLELEAVTEFHWQEPEPTDNNHSLLITGVTLDEEPLAVGDEIGIFTQAGLLAGRAVWPLEERIGIAAWGDDIHTEEVIEGFAADEPFTFVVWDRLCEAECPAEPHFNRGPEVYTPNGFSVLELAAHRVLELPEIEVQLNRGWNITSINVAPPEEFYSEEEDRGPDVVLMMAQLVDQGLLEILKNGSGQFYIPDFDFNNIPYWNLAEGYQIRVTEDAAAIWTGEAISPDTDITLQEGWNIIAYFPGYELSCEPPEFAALSPILDDVLIAKDVRGHFAVPEFDYSNMPPWRETQGYYVKVGADVVLNYPDEQEEGALFVEASDDIGGHWTVPAATGSNMSVLVSAVFGLAVTEGDQISAFSSKDQLTGVGMVTADARCGLAVWGDDPSTKEIDGMNEEETFTLRLWDADNNTEYELLVQPVQDGNGLVYMTDGFVALDVLVKSVVPNEYYLSQNYPNPFNDMTRLSFGLPKASRVSISIYDVTGRLAASLVDGDMIAGHHTVVWNARSVSTGLYLAQMKASGFNTVCKIVLVK